MDIDRGDAWGTADRGGESLMYIEIRSRVQSERVQPSTLLISPEGQRILKREIIDEGGYSGQVGGAFFGMRVVIDPSLKGKKWYLRWDS